MAEQYQSREERRKQLEKQKQSNKKKGKKPTKGLFMKIFLILVALGITGIVVGAATFAYMIKDTPELDEALLKDPISSQVFDMNGDPFTEIGSVKRDYVNYEDIPETVRDAFIATEDSRFFEHNGIDLIRLGGAVIANVTDGFGSEGASTITQQVVKNSFLTHEKTLSRKAQEAWLSFQLEQQYTKEEIFEIYVNKNWMGSGGHGVATAAKTYYDKSLDELTLDEAALLAGLPQSPANYDPFKYPEKAKKRRDIVLSLMNQHGYITEEEMVAAQSVDVSAALVPEDKRETNGEIAYDSFVGQVIKEIEEKYPDLDPFSEGLKIYTTLDTSAQEYVEQILDGNEIVEFPDEKFQAGITLLDTKTGAIRALGGGRNQTQTFGFNYATDPRRQPGSTIKPVLDYGPAIEYLNWGTYQTLVDEPYTYSSGQEINNWDNKHMGSMTMRTALALSRNIPALKAMQEVGLDKSKEFGAKLGIPVSELTESYSIGGLGGADKGVSSLQMAGAYSAFGNNGFYTEPYSVVTIELRDGTKLDLKPETEVVMKDYTAFMITDMLKDVLTYGTGSRARVDGLAVAGKTGTTNYPKAEKDKYGIPTGAVPDSWFVGYTTNYTAAVWTGYDDRTKNWLTSDEQKISQLIFKNLMTQVSQGKETADFAVPNSVEKVRIEKGTFPAKLASEYTPNDQVIIEYAVKGSAPKQVSNKYDKPSAPSNLKVTLDEATKELLVTWEYSGDNAEGVQFQLYGSLNDGGEQLLNTTAEKQVRLKAETPGYYTFKVIAVRDTQLSEAVTTTIEVVIPQEEEEQEVEEEETENEEGTDEGTTETGETGGNSNTGNTGTGTGTGNGNGNTSTGNTGNTNNQGSGNN
ncbi:PBP1A family penicillin-binding protein [Robertmurraya sp. GLU-23]